MLLILSTIFSISEPCSRIASVEQRSCSCKSAMRLPHDMCASWFSSWPFSENRPWAPRVSSVSHPLCQLCLRNMPLESTHCSSLYLRANTARQRPAASTRHSDDTATLAAAKGSMHAHGDLYCSVSGCCTPWVCVAALIGTCEGMAISVLVLSWSLMTP